MASSCAQVLARKAAMMNTHRHFVKRHSFYAPALELVNQGHKPENIMGCSSFQMLKE